MGGKNLTISDQQYFDTDFRTKWGKVQAIHAVMPEPVGPGGPPALPIFGRSVNPIPIGKGRLFPPITTGTPNVFQLPASLNYVSIFWLNYYNFS